MTYYPYGQPVVLSSGTVKDEAGNPTDPATLALTVLRPDGATDGPFNLGVLTRVSTGLYTYAYSPALAGHYDYRWVATGPGAAGENTFDVTASNFGSDAGSTFVPSGLMTVAEFKALPTGVTFDDLIRAGSAKINDAELANILLRASRWCDDFCQVPLAATVTTAERQQIRIGSDGLFKISPRNISGKIPLITMTRLAYGYPGSLTATITPTYPPWIQDGAVLVPGGFPSKPWIGPAIQFGSPPPGTGVWVEYDYVSGFANSWLAVAATAGDTSLRVADATGITPGLSMRLCDPGLEEQVTVASSWAPTTGPQTVPITAALVNAHAVAVGCSAVPMDVKLAAGQIAVTIIRRSADTGRVQDFGAIGPGIDQDAKDDMPNYTQAAAAILAPYRRVGAD